MEAPRSSTRPHRSYPNLHNLSLAPLSPKHDGFDLSAPLSPPGHGQTHTAPISYIAQKSAPTTPGILSRSSSRNGRHRRPKKSYAYDGYFRPGDADAHTRDVGDIHKANSTGAMHTVSVSFADEKGNRHHERKGTGSTSLRVSHMNNATDEWLHRAGLAIAGETRDSKGQGWLVRRDSSTSVVPDDYEPYPPMHDGRHMVLLSGENLADGDFNTFSPRLSRNGSRTNSRMGSRVQSARNSRRGSRVGSRVDLIMSAGPRTPSGRHSLELDDSMFDDSAAVEPDFVEGNEDSDSGEEEIARLAKERGFGLGSWMDRLIGWTLFSVDEDGEESDEENEQPEETGSERTTESLTKEELQLRREVEARRRKLEREAIISASAVRSDVKTQKGAEEEEPPNAQNEEGGGWSDAAWLFSVASKVIL